MQSGMGRGNRWKWHFLSHPIEQFTSLYYIQLTSVGFDRVPMDYVKLIISRYTMRGAFIVFQWQSLQFAECWNYINKVASL